jgi:hypothetical protein
MSTRLTTRQMDDVTILDIDDELTLSEGFSITKEREPVFQKPFHTPAELDENPVLHPSRQPSRLPERSSLGAARREVTCSWQLSSVAKSKEHHGCDSKPNEGRKLVCPQFGQDLAKRRLAKGAIGDCDDQHGDPRQYIAEQVSESFPTSNQHSLAMAVAPLLAEALSNPSSVHSIRFIRSPAR